MARAFLAADISGDARALLDGMMQGSSASLVCGRSSMASVCEMLV